MAQSVGDDEDEPLPAKIPKILKRKDQDKRLIVVLENSSLETVKVGISYQYCVATIRRISSLNVSCFRFQTCC